MSVYHIIGLSGSVQLRGGGTTSGIVEYCSGGTWKAVCDSGWDYKDAFVVCRQLRLPATRKYACDTSTTCS